MWLALACCAGLPAQSLRELAAERGVRISAAAEPNRLSEASYASTLSREFDQLEPENAMKFGPIHPARSTYNFTGADALAAFARANNMGVRGHTLVWHSQNPGWLTGGNFAPEQLSSILQEHISTVVRRYAGQVNAWDVVNEAFNDNGTLRSTLWYNNPGIGLAGTGYMEQAFRWAHEADPKALLFYNDYSAETINAKSNAIYEMARDFVARGVPIHGIGMQMHLTASPPALASMEANIRRITELGLEVQFTELDVRLPVDASGAASAGALATQAQIYRDITALCLKFPRCTLIQTWGFTDRYSWVPGTFAGQGAALIFDRDYQPKPAYEAMNAALRTAPPAIHGSGIGSAASYASGAVSPGEIVVLFGANFGAASLAVAQPEGGRIPSSLAETRVLFDGIPAPLLYTRARQTGAIVPFGVSGKAGVQVEYEYRGMRSAAVGVTLVPSRPGVFTLDGSGRGPGAILDSSYRVISSGNPARRDAIVLLFATGAGTIRPAPADGEIAAGPPLPAVASPVSVTIGGVDCAVLYAGGAAGLVAGAIQVNVRIAAAVPSGEQPVVLTIGEASSQPEVTLAVEETP